MDATKIQQIIDAYTDAELNILSGVATEFNGKKLTIADLDSIRAGRKEYERKLERAKGHKTSSLARFK